MQGKQHIIAAFISPYQRAKLSEEREGWREETLSGLSLTFLIFSSGFCMRCFLVQLRVVNLPLQK